MKVPARYRGSPEAEEKEQFYGSVISYLKIENK
jgi:hypothetical protein